VLSNFDIYASAGGQNKAIARSFTASANSSGQIVIQFTSVTENPKINGISIKPGTAPPTVTPTPTRQGATPTPTRQSVTPTPTSVVNPTPTPTLGSGSISIAAGSSSAVGSFQADQYYSGGSTYRNSNTVDVSQITSDTPPAALFNNERYGAMSYTIPGFTAGSPYAVTLYFAETYLSSSGSRRFNVSINGATVLSNFDIYASAGGQNKAIARSFTATANSSGQIVIQFTSVTENPKINGISIKPGTAPPTTTPTPTRQGATPTPTRGSTNGVVYLAFDDGPNNSNSGTLVNTLKNNGVTQATMFVWGNRISSNSSGWSAYTSSGFSLQNHTYTHSHMTSWSYQQVYNDIQQCNQAIQNAGKPKPSSIRLPYLESNSTIQQACSALGLTIISPNIDSQDWNGASTQSIISSVSNLQNGQNALMHDQYSTTISALPSIIQNLKNKGLGFAQY
jgi:peptidoglycan/xylan/chitin deacetylase (PgdA/CDA1 family)